MQSVPDSVHIIHRHGDDIVREYNVKPALPYIVADDPFFIKSADGQDSMFECKFMSGDYGEHVAIYNVTHKPDAIYINRQNTNFDGVVFREHSFIAPVVGGELVMGIYMRPQEAEMMTLVGDAMDDMGFNELWYSSTKGYMLVSRIRPYPTGDQK